MSKCENCIHYDVCLDIEESLGQILNCISIKHIGCRYFKDKSLFVELPCKVGDTVYKMSRGEIIPMIVNSISFNGNCEYMLNCSYEDEETHGYSLLTFTEKTKGYYWELTREEAERGGK